MDTPLCNIIYPSPISGHLDCFYFLALVKTAMNTCIQVFVQTYGFISRNAVAGSYGKFIFNFLRKCQTVFEQLNHFILTPAMHKNSNFSASLSAFQL